MTEPLLTARELGELLAFSPATMRLYFESISNERYQAERRVRGLWNIRWVLSHYEEAALRDDVHGMGETLRVLRDELDRQQANLEQRSDYWTAERQKRRQRRA